MLRMSCAHLAAEEADRGAEGLSGRASHRPDPEAFDHKVIRAI